MRLTENEVRSYCYQAGFRGTALDYAVKIAYCESGFNTDAHNTNNEDSRGLFQINVNANPKYLTYDLFDALQNCTAAYDLFVNWGFNFKAWTCAKQLGLTEPKKKDDLIFGIAIAFIVGTVLYLT